MNRFFLIGDFPFPAGSAAASRMRQLAEGFAAIGHPVHVVALSQHFLNADMIVKEEYVYADKITYAYPPNVVEFWLSSNRLKNRNLKERIAWFLWIYLASWMSLIQFLRVKSVSCDDVAILYGRSACRLVPWKLVLESLGITVVVDVVEKNEVFSGFSKKINPVFWDWCLGSELLYRGCDGATVITTGLEQHVKEKGGKYILRVPALGEVGKGDLPMLLNEGPIRFLYVGALLEKDAAELLCESFALLAEKGYVFKLQVAGRYLQSSEGSFYYKRLNSDKRLAGKVDFFENPSDLEMKKLMESADVLLLLRRASDVELNSFPTRLVEYLASDRPVAVSDWGDIGLYLEDDKDAILLPAGSSLLICNRLSEILDGGRDGLKKFVGAGKKAVAKNFCRKLHARRIIHFTEGLNDDFEII